MIARTAAGLVRLRAAERRSPAAVRRMQERKLRELVRHAYDRVPFYRRLFDGAGVRPGDVRGLDDLRRLPLVSKRELLAQPQSDILAAGVDPRECRVSASSGTTGTPLTVYSLAADKTMMNLSWTRAYLANGMRPWDRLAAFIGQRPGARSPRWHERVGLFRRNEISAWLGPEEWVAILQRWRPQVITGYVMTLRLLAEYVRDNGIEGVTPRIVFHTSALLDDGSRRLFEEVFKARVVNIYGSDEAGCIAWECPACRESHVSSDMLIVEVLADGRPVPAGGSGEVVITNLHSHAMPFIRYRQEDVVQLSRNAPRCGRPFPLIARIEGRVEDFLVLRNGARMPPHPFYHCIDPVPGVKRWRIVQEDAGTMRVELEPGPDLAADRLRRIHEDLAALTRGEMEIEIRTVGEIPIAAGAKFRTILSKAAGRCA